jgi:3'(2'), 5'-bisphosphate nucleotidase
MSLNTPPRLQCVEQVIPVALQAGQAIMAIYAGDIVVQAKADCSPLTQADLAAHEVIKAGLSSISPSYPVVSEESEITPFEERKKSAIYWLIDPLDGTREFIKRNDEFTVNIALIAEHEPVLGVVYAPALDLLYFACRGQGAYKQIGEQPPTRIVARDFDPSTLSIAGSRSHAGDRLKAFLGKIGPHRLMSVGSSLKICYVAEGVADLYPRLGPTSEWDTAAAQCILEEAGGKLIGTHGEAMRYNTKASLLNPEFFAMGANSTNWSEFLE